MTEVFMGGYSHLLFGSQGCHYKKLDFDGFGSFILDAISYICAGISLKTQELYAIVFTTRYLDLFTTYISLYNTIMKLIFLGSSISIVWYMRHHKMVRRSYDKDQDTFRHYILILPCLILALLINEKFTFKEVSTSFCLLEYDISMFILITG